MAFRARNRKRAAPADGSPAPVAEPGETQEAHRNCGTCGCTFTVTAPAAGVELTGALTCPVCRTPC